MYLCQFLYLVFQPWSLYLWSTLLLWLTIMLLIWMKFSFLTTLLLSSGLQSLSNSIFISSTDFLISFRCLSAIFRINSGGNSCSLSSFNIILLKNFCLELGAWIWYWQNLKQMDWWIVSVFHGTFLLHWTCTSVVTSLVESFLTCLGHLLL